MHVKVTTRRLLCGTVGIFRAVYSAALLGLGLSIGSTSAALIEDAVYSGAGVASEKAVSIMEEQCEAYRQEMSPDRLWVILFFPLLIVGMFVFPSYSPCIRSN